MYISSIFSSIEQKEQDTHIVINKYNERRVDISAELDVTKEKELYQNEQTSFFR